MTPEELELITVEIVAYAGDARSKYVEALMQMKAILEKQKN